MSGSKAKRERKARIFDAYAANLSLGAPNFHNVFACPLCMTVYEKDALEKKITEEHIISRKLGGQIFTLTCTQCNSQDGSSLDSHLINKFRTDDKLAGLSDDPFRGKLKVEGAEQSVDIYHTGASSSGFLIVGDPKRTNPKALNTIQQALAKGTQEMSLSVKKDYIPRNVSVACIRAAYLLMFRYFGYEFILQDNMVIVREQIKNPESDLIASRAVIKFNDSPEIWNSISVINTPSDLRCFFVCLNFSTKIDRQLGVILPGFDAESKYIYDRWGSARDSLKGLSLGVTYFLPNPNAPIEYIYRGHVSFLWNSVK